jgi:aspartate/methionine/tyrosine aminotransferase
VAFGASGEGYVRLCFAASERTITDGLERLAAFCRRRASRPIPPSHAR